MDPELVVASANHAAALGSLVLFCAEGLLIAILAWPWKKPRSVPAGPFRAA
jgi:hypothetical protein